MRALRAVRFTGVASAGLRDGVEPAVVDCEDFDGERVAQPAVSFPYRLLAVGVRNSLSARWERAYKAPRALQFVADLPKTSTGKIMRRELRKLDGRGRTSAAARYSVGAGFTGNGPSPNRAADLSSRGLKAPITRSVSEDQSGGAGTVGPFPGPGTICTIR